MIGNPNNPNNPNQNQRGTGFTNLNRIIGANKQNQLGSTVASGLSQQGQQARQGIQQGSQSFNQQSQANRLDSEANKQKVQTILNAPESASDQDVSAFQNIAQGRYSGPQSLQNEEAIVNRANQAQQLGQLAGSSGGRQTLLQRFVGGAGYNQGKQRLDNLLLGQTGAQNLTQAQRNTAGLSQQANQAAESARQQGQYLANQAQEFGKQAVNQATGNQQAISSQIDDLVNSVSQNEQVRSQLYDTIRQGLSDPTIDWSNQEQALGKVNNVLNLASQNSLLNPDEMKKVQDIYSTLQTPIQKLYRQTVQTGPGGFLGYGGGGSSYTYTGQGDNPLYAQLKLNQVLQDAFTSQGAENINRAGVADEQQKARMNALSKLLGQTQEFTGKEDKFKAGTAAFDLNKAGRMTDEEIARVKGEAIEDLPTEYQDVPIQEKLRRTLAPTGSETAQDLSQDISGVLGSDQSLGSRAAALARLGIATPFRTATGAVVTPVMQSLNDANKDLNKVTSGNVGQMAEGVGGLAYAPTSLAANAIGNTANLTEGLANSAYNAVPGGTLGKAALAPLVAPIDFLGKAAGEVGNVANMVANPVSTIKNAGIGGVAQAALAPILAPVNVAKKAVSSIGNIFCYGAGTKIKMANGSFKAVDKLKIGDSVYMGGKVTAVGESLADNLYKYKGTVVTGSHAVFENGKFIRVQDSSVSNKISKKEKVYPIVTENHILVTDTHIGADFAETDDAHNMTPEKRIKELNSDSKNINKLDKANLLLFGNKKNVKDKEVQ